MKVHGIVAENASMFKSALTPAKLGFKTVDNNLYWVRDVNMVCFVSVVLCKLWV